MGKYISSIKDLVILVMTNGSQVIYKANSGEPESCFQVGMMHLLGINTPVDFKKASHYLSNQSLVGNQDATLLLAFIAECEGDYSKAFRQYANTISSETDAYIDKVIKGRNNLQDFLKKQNLPISLNKEISSILSNYGKGKSSRTGACTKIAAICNDEPTCIEVAKCLFDAKDYISAIDWLKRGNVEPNDSMFITINKKLKESTLGLLNSKDLQVINLENISLLSKEDPTPFFKKVKDTCHEASMKCREEWKDKNKSFIDKLIKEQKNQEYLASLAAEEEAKRKKRTRNLLIGFVIVIILGILTMAMPSSNKNSDTDNSNNNEYVLSGNKKFHGDVDKYPITMELQIDGEKVNGSLYYDKYGPDNILVLSGGLNKNEIELNESEKNGKPTGHFRGKYSNGVFQGEYTTSKGKTMSFAVSE
jgi:hypothetical protein